MTAVIAAAQPGGGSVNWPTALVIIIALLVIAFIMWVLFR